MLAEGVQGAPSEASVNGSRRASPTNGGCMKATYRVLAGLICLLVLVQAAAIAFGTFGILSFVDGGDAYTKSVAEERASDAGGIGQNIHSFGAMAVTLVPLALLVV